MVSDLTAAERMCAVTFDKELETYRRELPRLILEGKGGQHALIRGDEILGYFPDFERALAAGYERCGEDFFLIKQVGEPDRPIHSSRSVRPCRS